ncbi:MAG: CoA transferase [Chloroflexi bacterium]|nr:CoA transferase [Chloroflexota bacterium]
MGSLEHLRVIELASTIAGPVAAMHLADHGADVIKVEPLAGELSRSMKAASFVSRNRNKRSICIDLDTDAGRRVFYRLVERSDVLITNMLPAQTERLGVTYEALRPLNGRLIYAHVTGYGGKGTFANEPAFDQILQARTGLVGARRMPDGTPVVLPVYVSDYSAGIMLAYGICMALLGREKTGVGQKAEVSLLDMALGMQAHEMVTVHGRRAPSEGGQAQAVFNVYKCQDGKWLTFAVPTQRHWVRLCEVLDLGHLAVDPALAGYEKRAQRAAELYSLFEGIFQTQPRDKWLKELEKAGLPAGPILDRSEVMDDPVVREHASLIEIDYQGAGPFRMPGIPLAMSSSPGTVRLPPPQRGQHTDEVLRELKYSAGDIQQLRQNRAVG